MNETLEVVAEDNNRCGEGPIWDPVRRRLIWTDFSSNLVYQFVPATGEKTIISRNLMVSGIALTRTGELVFVGSSGLHLWRGQDQYRTLLAEYDGEVLFFNDLVADPKGRIYVGTCYWNSSMKKLGKLYLVEGTGKARVIDDGIELANGLGFSLDNRILYFADSTARRIYAYDVDPETGGLSKKRVFAQVPKEEGVPDGLTVDRDGYVWSAQWYGAQVVRYDPDGKVARRIAMPVKQVSSVAFGGEQLTDLYVTTASEPWRSAYAPPGYEFNAPNMGGSLYRVRLEVQGKPEDWAAFIWS